MVFGLSGFLALERPPGASTFPPTEVNGPVRPAVSTSAEYLAKALDLSPHRGAHAGAIGHVQGEPPPIPLNFDRFHQPCLLTWRVLCLEAGIGADCGPCTTWRSFNLSCRQHGFSSLRLTGGATAGRLFALPAVPSPDWVFAWPQVRDPRGSAAACSRQAFRTPPL